MRMPRAGARPARAPQLQVAAAPTACRRRVAASLARGAEVAALAGDARAAAGAALERELGDLEPVARQRGAQPAVAQVQPFDRRAQRQLVGAPACRSSAARCGCRTAWHRHRACRRCASPAAPASTTRPGWAGAALTRPASGASVGPLPAAVALLHAGAGLGVDLAGALAVPGQVGAHGVALASRLQLGLAQAGRRAGRVAVPAAASMRDLAGGAGAGAADARHQRGLAGLHADVAALRAPGGPGRAACRRRRCPSRRRTAGRR